MKNEPWIDRVYKENIPKLEIPFNEQHWLLAQQMISAQDTSRKKNKWFFWMLLIGLVGLGASAFTFIILEKNKSVEPTPLQPKDQPVKSLDSVAGLNEIRPFAQSSDEKIMEAASMVKIAEDESQKKKATTHGINSHLTLLNKNTIHKKSVSSDIAFSNINAQLPTPTLIETSDPAIATVPGTMNQNRSAVHIENIEQRSMDLQREKSLIVASFSDLPIELKKASWKERGVRFSFASENNGATNALGLSQLALELFGQKSIRGGLYFSYGLGYISGFNKSNYAQILSTYQFSGFSGTENKFGVKPEWTHQLYALTTIGFKYNNHHLNAGIRPEWLVGVHGELNQLIFHEGQNKSIQKAQAATIQQGWLDQNILNTLTGSLTFGYEYRVFHNLGVGITVNHRLRSAFKPLSGYTDQSPVARWNTGFRMTYLFK